MNEMIERVARAIYETKTDSEFVGAGAGPEHDLAFDLARAAIEAMREPILAKLAERQAIYVAKAERLSERGSDDDDDPSRADLATHAAEAMGWAAGDLGALFDAALAESPK